MVVLIFVTCLFSSKPWYPTQSHSWLMNVQIPLVIWSLLVLEVNDVGAHLIQERTEVTGADDGSGEGFQPIFQPLDVVHVQVTRGFIQHQHVGVHQLGSTSERR